MENKKELLTTFLDHIKDEYGVHFFPIDGTKEYNNEYIVDNFMESYSSNDGSDFDIDVEPILRDGSLRRNRIDLCRPAENAIRTAVDEVEKMGAHPTLTDIVNELHAVREKLADHIDGIKR